MIYGRLEKMVENIDVFTQSSIRIHSVLGVIYFDPYGIVGEPHDAEDFEKNVAVGIRVVKKITFKEG